MMIKNKKKIILILIVCITILAIALLILNKTGVINKTINNSKQEDIKKEISYEVYHYINGNTKILVVAEDTENGIEKIIYPNNEMELYCNGKNKVAFDYNTDITEKESITFKAINTLGEEIEKTILINDQFYLNLINYNFTAETESQKVLTVNYKAGSTTKQYRIGNSSAWVNYGSAIRLDDYQILETLGYANSEIKIGLRQIDTAGNEIISEINYKMPIYKQEDTVIEGESIIDCIENNELESGNYIFKVTYNEAGNTISYPVELYNYDGNSNYITNNNAVIAGRTYTGMGKISSEKRMLILKYNGDLTINSGVIITPTGTNASINGATYLCTKKGMFIYCAGTLTNNGTITMTSKGTVNQAGENVYLYKNENNTYEYVPAIGATGGTRVAGAGIGNSGQSGNLRRTGGGGSGGMYGRAADSSGAGGNGTSYSSGTGGGALGYPNTYTDACNGSSIGGAGGRAYSSSRHSAGGGAGNPGGVGSQGGYNGSNGTGGLLIIEANTIRNNGTMSSNGSAGGYAQDEGGGASGGGSINIFYNNEIGKGTITAAGGFGGATQTNICKGGNGGAGSITIGNISTGTFVKN